jgi:predicted ribosome-associated RNA-binding protein Tma20/translation initiation factor 1 (eIF-1/SUI1)
MFKSDSCLESTKSKRTLRKSDRRQLELACATFSPRVAAALAAADDVALKQLPATEPECMLVLADGDALAIQFERKRVSKHAPAVTVTMPTVLALAAVTPAERGSGLLVFDLPSHVFEFLSRGADIMLPGVRNDLSTLSDFAVDDVACIAVNGVVIAVGLCLMSRAEALDAIAQNAGKGRLVRVWHRFGDALWQAGSRAGHDTIVAALHDQVRETADVAATAPVSDDAASASAAPAPAPAASEPALSADEVLAVSFFRGCAATPDADLPVLASTLFERMIANRPAGTTIELKASKHKRLLPFLQAMAETGAVQLKESARGSGVWSVTEIDRDSDAYRDAAAAAQVAASEAAAAKAPSILHSTEAGCIDVLVGRERVAVALPGLLASLPTKRWPQVVQLLQLDDSLLALAAGVRELIAAEDAPAVIGGIVRDHTASAGKNTCTLNASLAALLPDVSGTVAKRLVADRVGKLLKPCWFSLGVDGTASKVHKCAVPTVRVEEVTIRGHKCTVVHGLSALFDVSLSDVCEAWRAQLSSGCSLDEHGAIVVQGLHERTVAQLLAEHFCVPESAIVCKALKKR